MAIRIIYLLVYGISLFAFSQGSEAEDYEKAVVKSESLALYSAMSVKSDVVKSLKKGDTVSIDLELMNSEGVWCGIIGDGKTETMGFALCEGLERTEVPKTRWGSTDNRTPESFEKISPEGTMPGEYPLKTGDKVAQADVNRFVEAAGQGNRSTVKAMIEKGVNVNAKNDSGNTALAAAIMFLNKESKGMAEFLIEMGADVNQRSNGCLSPVLKTMTTECENVSPLTLSRAWRKHIEEIIKSKRATYLLRVSKGYFKESGSLMKDMIKGDEQLADIREIERILIEAGAAE